jgi:predicted dehydrogenase
MVYSHSYILSRQMIRPSQPRSSKETSMKIGTGAGFMGTTHAAGWADTPATIVGFTAETPQEANSLAKRYETNVYSSLDEMLPDVDVVDICSPTHLHYEMALKAAAAGKHIVCEKPLARTTKQAREIVAACRKTGVQLLVAHVVRFFPEWHLLTMLLSRVRLANPG